MDKLTDRERLVLARRFPAQIKNKRTLKQVAEELGVSRERIRQIEAKALRKSDPIFRAELAKKQRPKKRGRYMKYLDTPEKFI